MGVSQGRFEFRHREWRLACAGVRVGAGSRRASVAMRRAGRTEREERVAGFLAMGREPNFPSAGANRVQRRDMRTASAKPVREEIARKVVRVVARLQLLPGRLIADDPIGDGRADQCADNESDRETDEHSALLPRGGFVDAWASIQG